MMFTPEELNLLRQWYNAVDDLDLNYLEDADQALALKIVRQLQMAGFDFTAADKKRSSE